MKQFNNLKVKQKGVSLIEMLAAVAIFSITVGAISGIFVSAIRTQRRVLATQELLDQTSYVLEYTGRFLRMARKQTDELVALYPDLANCLSLSGLNYENPGGDDSKIRFINYHDPPECQEFSREWDAGAGVYKLKEKIKVGTVSEEIRELTSKALDINSLKFNLSGEAQTDEFQPRITIFLQILGRGATGERPKIQIQTSISQRNLDIRR